MSKTAGSSECVNGHLLLGHNNRDNTTPKPEEKLGNAIDITNKDVALFVNSQ